MIAVISSDKDLSTIEWLTKALSHWEETGSQETVKIAIAYFQTDGAIAVDYRNLGYTDLQRIGQAIQDDATIAMIAENQERLERYIADLDTEKDGF